MRTLQVLVRDPTRVVPVLQSCGLPRWRGPGVTQHRRAPRSAAPSASESMVSAIFASIRCSIDVRHASFTYRSLDVITWLGLGLGLELG